MSAQAADWSAGKRYTVGDRSRIGTATRCGIRLSRAHSKSRIVLTLGFSTDGTEITLVGSHPLPVREGHVRTYFRRFWATTASQLNWQEWSILRQFSAR